MVSRRKFMKQAAGAAVALMATDLAHPQKNENGGMPSHSSLLGNRFVTHVSVVSVDGIEVSRKQWIGGDVSASNSPERVRARRNAFREGNPNGRMTWGLSWGALNDTRQQYKDVRRLMATYHDTYGDEITFFAGGYFSPMYDTRSNVNRDVRESLGLITNLIGGGYRPQSIIAGFMAADNQYYLAKEEGIHVCQGQIWSQHAIDHGDGDGGISYPYYPSREHFLKPAQGPADFIDCVCLDGWTCDFLAARHNGVSKDFNSRMGLGPIETVNNLGAERGRRVMLDTTALHFDSGLKLNGFAWVTAIWEVSLPASLNVDLTYWLQATAERWPDTQVVTEGEFGSIWRQHYRDNSAIDYRFVEQGIGVPGSETDKEIRWYMNKEFRLCFLRNLTPGGTDKVIDFTRYDLPVREPSDLRREWSLMNILNQKGTRSQDAPISCERLSQSDRLRILRKYPELQSSCETPHGI